MKKEFFSNGKLLLTGEYVVLEGAKALAFPTKYGQSMTVEIIDEPIIQWKSYDCNNHIWFLASFSISDIDLISTTKDKKEKRLISILKEAKKMNPSFLNGDKGYIINTKLDFPENWGLGSSSTLINNISDWAMVDPYHLLKVTFGGSGYDIAAARNDFPIVFSQSFPEINITKQDIQWNFTDQLFFVHLNKKQNSRDEIANYIENKKEDKNIIEKINELTIKICNSKSLTEFEILINKHEQIISNSIQQKTIKESLFNNYRGSIKSLGAWGGDFILVTGSNKDKEYFKEKGFNTILSFKDMIL